MQGTGPTAALSTVDCHPPELKGARKQASACPLLASKQPFSRGTASAFFLSHTPFFCLHRVLEGTYFYLLFLQLLGLNEDLSFPMREGRLRLS